jgi:hypothetical protein
MVLNHETSGAHPQTFCQKRLEILHMMQHINDDHAVETLVLERDPFAVVFLNANPAFRAYVYVNPTDVHVRPHGHQVSGYHSTSGPDIEDLARR